MHDRTHAPHRHEDTAEDVRAGAVLEPALAEWRGAGSAPDGGARDLLESRAAELDVVVGPWPAAAPDEGGLGGLAGPEGPRRRSGAGEPQPGRGGASPLEVLAGLADDGDEGLLGWQERALCAQTDPEAFFPEKGGSTREAKRVCVSCDVRAECLEYALLHDERFGIWGGLSERERRKLKRRAV